MVPYLGWAHETHQTAPSWLFGMLEVCLLSCWCAMGGHLPFECFGQAVLVAFNLEDLDRLVGGACCQSSAVVVEDSIVLLPFPVSQSSCMRSGRDGSWLGVRTIMSS
jgi:hypothetical protein